MREQDYGADPFHKELAAVRHNATDHDAYKRFMKRQEAIFGKQQEEREVKQRKANVAAWVRTLPYPWNEALLSKNEDVAAVEAFERIHEEGGFANLFVKGDPNTGKTFLAHAIIRRYIGLGYVAPSQIKHLSQDTNLNMRGQGFEGNKLADEIYSKKYKLYLIDNVGPNNAQEKNYDSRYRTFWDIFTEHVSTNDLAFILTSNFGPQEFAKSLNKTASAKLRFLIGDNVVTTTVAIGGDYSDQEETSADRAAQAKRGKTKDALKNWD